MRCHVYYSYTYVAIEGSGPGADYSISDSTITFGIGITTTCFSVVVSDDDDVELNEVFVIQLSGFPAELPQLVNVSNIAQVTIEDDDREYNLKE